MGRKYKRKTNKQRDSTALENALKEVKEKGASVRVAAAMFGVPRSTLHDYVQRSRTRPAVDQTFQLATYSVRQVLTPSMEEELAIYLKDCSKLFHGLSTNTTKRLAYEYAIANKVSVPESWARNEAAGRDWLTGFLERQGDLSLRTPEATSLARMTSFNRTNLGIFQTKLETVLQRYQFSESCIYNLDETGCTTVQKVPKIITQKGVHQVGQVTSRERGELVTMVAIICANGNALPPCFVFPRVRFDQTRMMNGAPPACTGLAHPTGWMTSKNFVNVLKHFVLISRCSLDHKVLMIMDNHESHLSIEAIDYAREHGIVMLTLPPHTSNKLQPLDRTVYGPFKTYYNQGLNAWMLQHPGRPATIYDLAPIMSTAWDRAATPVNIKSGFRSTGIHPFDTGVFQEEDFAGAYVTDRPLPNHPTPTTSATSQGVPGQPEPTPPNHPTPTTSATSQGVTGQPDPTPPNQQEPTTTVQTHQLDQPSGVQTQVSNPQQSQQASATSDLNRDEESVTIDLLSEDTVKPISTTGHQLHVSPRDIRPFPKAAPRKETVKGRKRGKCMIATDSPEKFEIEQKLKKRNETKAQKKIKFAKESSKAPKINVKKARKETTEDQSSDEDVVETQHLLTEELNKSSDFSEDEFDDPEVDFVDKFPEQGDFVVIGIDPIRGSKVHYVGRLISDVDEDNEFQVSYLRKSLKGRSNSFHFPDIEDEASVHRDAVIGVLPKPVQQSVKRRQGYFNFCFSFAGYNMR